MSMGTKLSFDLPEDWTLRKVASAMVRDWLPAFRAEPAAKAARWVLQSVVEDPGKGEIPLWEPGISTEEFEARMERFDLAWVIRATAGRGKGTILARFSQEADRPGAFQMECSQVPLPETLFDKDKVTEFLGEETASNMETLCVAILRQNGF